MEDDGENVRDLLEKFRVDVVQSLDLDRHFMLSYLRSNSVLDDEDCQLILNSGSSRQQKNSKFLDVIACRGPDAYQHFVNALEFEHSNLYHLFTGKKASLKRDYVHTNESWNDYDKEYLAKELTNISDQYRTMAYMQSRTIKEKQLVEKRLLETASELQAAKQAQEEIKLQLKLINNPNAQAVETDQLYRFHQHCQELVQETSEKSNIIIALQARLLAMNEQYENNNKRAEDIQLKNQSLRQQVKDLTVNYAFQRSESLRLKDKVNQNNNEFKQVAGIQRQLHSLKFVNNNLAQERDEDVRKLEEYKSVVIGLNAKLSLLHEEKENESERRSEISQEYFKLRQQVKTLELEKDQLKVMSEYYKKRNEGLANDITCHKEQIAFFTKELEHLVTERNQAVEEKNELMNYNSELLKLRDEAVQSQTEISNKYEKRYKDVCLELEQVRDDLTKFMLADVRNNSSKENSENAKLFERELENSRKRLERTAVCALSEENEAGNDDDDVHRKYSLERSNTEVLTKAYKNLNTPTHVRRQSAPPNLSLTNRQLSWVYDTLKGSPLTFSTLLHNSMVFPQLNMNDTKTEDTKPERTRHGSSKRKTKKQKTKSKDENKYETLRVICPLISTAVGLT